MRAQEFVQEKINPSILEPDFSEEKTVMIQGEPYVLRASTLNSRMVPQIRIEAIAPNGKSVGYVRFVVHNADQRPGWFSRPEEPYLSAGNLSVWNDYQRRGIASAMYNFARELGNDIQPSGTQTDQGRAFWRAGAGERDLQVMSENLRKWFREKWVRFGPDGKIRGDCARGSDAEGKPKCLPQSKAHALGKKGRASAAARKRRQDPDADRRGAAKNVPTKKS
jgi:ribosomal protein S18 acetylase RimI-like enzyme